MQKLQAARRDLVLEAALAKRDKFDLIILDDITCAHKDQAETAVLFELIARRYEYRSIAIAGNKNAHADASATTKTDSQNEGDARNIATKETPTPAASKPAKVVDALQWQVGRLAREGQTHQSTAPDQTG